MNFACFLISAASFPASRRPDQQRASPSQEQAPADRAARAEPPIISRTGSGRIVARTFVRRRLLGGRRPFRTRSPASQPSWATRCALPVCRPRSSARASRRSCAAPGERVRVMVDTARSTCPTVRPSCGDDRPDPADRTKCCTARGFSCRGQASRRGQCFRPRIPRVCRRQCVSCRRHRA